MPAIRDQGASVVPETPPRRRRAPVVPTRPAPTHRTVRSVPTSGGGTHEIRTLRAQATRRLRRRPRGSRVAELAAETPAPRRPRNLAEALVATLATRLPRQSEFAMFDPEGADGRHAGLDWFAPPGMDIHSPVGGRIVDIQPAAPARSDQLFGGALKIEEPGGRVWAMRHIDPLGFRMGQPILPGQTLGDISQWAGPSHAHLELWRSLLGGYDFENMLDPLPILQQLGSLR